MTAALSPRSLAEALRWFGDEPSSKLVAGCTDLMVADTLRRSEMPRVIDLLSVPGLADVHDTGAFLEMGATATFAALGQNAVIRQCFPALSDAARAVGGWQIQARATIGGNIANASPAGDSPPVLLALDATVVAASTAGEREIPYDQFHVAYRKTALRPGELVRAVRLPWPVPGSRQAFRKVGTRAAQAISKIAVAMSVRIEAGRIVEARIGAGSVAATPIRLRAAETAAIANAVSEALATAVGKAAASEVRPIDDVRSTAEYRSFALERVARRLVLELGGLS
ncbi:MAG: xanthine dehydrogenase family protein subunit M [Acidobacteriota bacterium]